MMMSEPAMPSALPLHESLKAGSISEDEAEPTESVSSGGGSSRNSGGVGIPRTNSGNTINRIREFRRRKRDSEDTGEEKPPSDAPASGMVRSNSGNAINRIREYRKKRQESIGEQGIEGSSTTWQRHASTRRLDMHSESRQTEENPLLSPRNNRSYSRGFSGGVTSRTDRGGSSGTSTRRLTRDTGGASFRSPVRGSGGVSTRRLIRDTGFASTRRLTRDTGGASSRLLARDTSGASTRRLTRDTGGASFRSPVRDTSGASTRRLTRDTGGTSFRSPVRGSGGVSTRRLTRDTGGASSRLLAKDTSGASARRQARDVAIGWSRNNSTRSSNSQTSGTSSDLSISSKSSKRSQQSKHGNLSRTEQRRQQLREQQKAKGGGEHHHASSIDGDNLSSNSHVKGSTLELLALIKKRRAARTRGREETAGGGGRSRSGRASLSPVPSKRPALVRQRSSSFSPQGRRRKQQNYHKLPFPNLPLSPVQDEHEQPEGTTTKKWSYTAHSMSNNNKKKSSLAAGQRSLSSLNDSDSSGFSSNSDAEEDDMPRNPTFKAAAAKKNVVVDSSSSDDEDNSSHGSPKGVMDFRDGRPTAAARKTKTPEIDPVHQEKMKRMRAEMQELQEQLGRMEEDKTRDMQELRDHFDDRKAKMMESAKKKIHAHLESEWELKLYTMEVEKTRLDKMQQVLEEGKEELKASIADVQADIDELMKENKRLDAENKEIHRMYTHLSKWVMKTTKQNEQLEKAEEKLKKIYNGSVALMVEEKLSIVYRKFMYKVAQGVSCCNGFDFELNEEVWEWIKDVEAECNKEVIDLHDIDEWEEELELQREEDNSPLAGMRVDGEGMTTSTLGTGSFDFDLSKRSRRSSGSYEFDLSKRSRRSGESGSEEEEDDEYYYDDESETEYDERFEEGMERLNDSVAKFENVLAEVSVNLDAAQMNTLHDNKDMLLSIFKFLDVDGSGDIDVEEFKVGIDLLNKRLPEGSHFQDAEELFKMLDVDNSGTVDLEEFEKLFGNEDEDED